jgi:hypothetical protein
MNALIKRARKERLSIETDSYIEIQSVGAAYF